MTMPRGSHSGIGERELLEDALPALVRAAMLGFRAAAAGDVRLHPAHGCPRRGHGDEVMSGEFDDAVDAGISDRSQPIVRVVVDPHHALDLAEGIVNRRPRADPRAPFIGHDLRVEIRLPVERLVESRILLGVDFADRGAPLPCSSIFLQS